MPETESNPFPSELTGVLKIAPTFALVPQYLVQKTIMYGTVYRL